MVQPSANGDRFELTDPVSLPRAGGFLWNGRMSALFNCRGFTTAQFLQERGWKMNHERHGKKMKKEPLSKRREEGLLQAKSDPKNMSLLIANEDLREFFTRQEASTVVLKEAPDYIYSK